MSVNISEPTVQDLVSRIFKSAGPYEAKVTLGRAAQGREILDVVRAALEREFRCFHGQLGFSPALVGALSMYPGAHTAVFGLSERGLSLLAPEATYKELLVKGIEPRGNHEMYAIGGDPLIRQEQAVRKLAEALDRKFSA